MNVRKLVFNLVDKLTGNLVTEHYQDIKHKMSQIYKGKIDMRERVEDFLGYAVKNTTFYNKFADKKFHDLPIISKDFLKNNYQAFFSKKYEQNQLVKTTTSGSYGTPFTYYLTPSKKKRQQAEVIYFGKQANYEVGVKHAYIRVTDSKSKLKLFLQNELLIDPTNMNRNWFETYRNKLKNGYKVIIGYPSTLTALARYCIEKGDTSNDFSIEGIITTAEPLYKEQQEIIEKLFNCSVSNRYSTEEFGVLANSCKEGNLHINQATFYIEVLDININREVEPGEVGRIVVTDLYSHALPLIRYDIGDLGIYADKCTCGFNGKTLLKILGREVETIYDTNSNPVSPFAINGAMRDIDEVLQFQFIQKEKFKYNLIIVPLKPFTEEIKNEINERFLNILGRDAKISLHIKNDIPPLKSGKRPYIMQEYKII